MRLRRSSWLSLATLSTTATSRKRLGPVAEGKSMIKQQEFKRGVLTSGAAAHNAHAADHAAVVAGEDIKTGQHMQDVYVTYSRSGGQHVPR